MADKDEQRMLDALNALRIERGISQEQLGAEVARLEGRSTPFAQGAVSDWLAGNVYIPPKRLFAIERILQVPPGTLSRIVGYVPVGARESYTVEGAIRTDPDLTESQRTTLVGAYRASVRANRQARQQRRRKPRQGAS